MQGRAANRRPGFKWVQDVLTALSVLDDGDMDRRIDERDYVLRNLCRARQEVIAHPKWFAPDSLVRIDKAIRYAEEIRAARAA